MSSRPSGARGGARRPNRGGRGRNGGREWKEKVEKKVEVVREEKNEEYRSYTWASREKAELAHREEFYENWARIPNHVSTFAGSESYGKADGGRKDAQLCRPLEIAFSPFGQLYFSESRHRVRYISLDGDVVTFIGALGLPGNEDGHRSEAKLNRPVGISFSPFGDLFIADSFNNAIKKVDMTTEIVSTFVGCGPGFVDGPLKLAKMEKPQNIVFSPHGHLVFSDYGNKAIRIIKDGEVSTLIASQSANRPHIRPQIDFQLFHPGSLSYLPSGHLIVSHSTSHSNDAQTQVTRFSASGAATLLLKLLPLNSGRRNLPPAHPPGDRSKISSGDVLIQGVETPFLFAGPCSIGVSPNGDLYISESISNTLYVLNERDRFVVFAGTGKRGHKNGEKENATFGFPVGIAFDPVSKDMFICDSDENRIRRIKAGMQQSEKWDFLRISSFLGFHPPAFPLTSPLQLTHLASDSSWDLCLPFIREIAPELLNPTNILIFQNLPSSPESLDRLLRALHGVPVDQALRHNAEPLEIFNEIAWLIEWCLLSVLFSLKTIQSAILLALERRLTYITAEDVQKVEEVLKKFTSVFMCSPISKQLSNQLQQFEELAGNVVSIVVYQLWLNECGKSGEEKFQLSHGTPFMPSFFSYLEAQSLSGLALSIQKTLCGGGETDIVKIRNSILSCTPHFLLKKATDFLPHIECNLNVDPAELGHEVKKIVECHPFLPMLSNLHQQITESTEGHLNENELNKGTSIGVTEVHQPLASDLSNEMRSHPNYLIRSGADNSGQIMVFKCHDWVMAGRWPFFARSLSFGGFESHNRILECSFLPPLAIRWLLDFIYLRKVPTLCKASPDFHHQNQAMNLTTPVESNSQVDEVEACFALLENAEFYGFLTRTPLHQASTHQNDVNDTRASFHGIPPATTGDRLAPTEDFHSFILPCYFFLRSLPSEHDYHKRLDIVLGGASNHHGNALIQF